MIDITDRTHMPDMAELDEYIDNSLFNELQCEMERQHNALVSVEYSGDKILLGWNLRFRKAGKTLLRLYPKRGYFIVLIVVGRKEKERVESVLPLMSSAIQEIYNSTPEGMGQRWLLIELRKSGELYGDVLRLAAIRREAA